MGQSLYRTPTRSKLADGECPGATERYELPQIVFLPSKVPGGGLGRDLWGRSGPALHELLDRLVQILSRQLVALRGLVLRRGEEMAPAAFVGHSVQGTLEGI